MNGQPVALAVIEGAKFDEDNEGNTILEKTEAEEEQEAIE